MSSERKKLGALMHLYPGCCQKLFPELVKRHPDRRIVLITDPIYNIKFRGYDICSDSLSDEQYIDLISTFRGYPAVLMHYPEYFKKWLIPALGQPDRCLYWCYKNTCPRGVRVIGFWNLEPDFEQVRFGFSEQSKGYETRVNLTGRHTRPSFDWFTDIPQLRKNSIERRGNPHPCPLPLLLVKRIVAMSAYAGNLIVDPFAGSFTTAVAAEYFGLDFVGIELSEQYIRYGHDRIQRECRITPQICSAEIISVVKNSDRWGTPWYVYDALHEEFDFTLDAAAEEATAKCDHFFTPEIDGLVQDWGGERVFLNPPYSKILPWLQKAHESTRRGATVVCLLHADNSTEWYRFCLDHAHEIRQVTERIRFLNPHNGFLMGSGFNRPSIIAVFRPGIREGNVVFRTMSFRRMEAA